MKNIFAIANQKGGIGKTTITLDLGFELAKLNNNVLLIDLDPQASLSKNLLGENKLKGYKRIGQLFFNDNLFPIDYIASTNFLIHLQMRRLRSLVKKII